MLCSARYRGLVKGREIAVCRSLVDVCSLSVVSAVFCATEEEEHDGI
jgi:hypothetical protein